MGALFCDRRTTGSHDIGRALPTLKREGRALFARDGGVPAFTRRVKRQVLAAAAAVSTATVVIGVVAAAPETKTIAAAAAQQDEDDDEPSAVTVSHGGLRPFVLDSILWRQRKSVTGNWLPVILRGWICD